MATICPPRMIGLTSTVGRQVTSAPRTTKAPTGRADNETPAPSPRRGLGRIRTGLTEVPPAATTAPATAAGPGPPDGRDVTET